MSTLWTSIPRKLVNVGFLKQKLKKKPLINDDTVRLWDMECSRRQLNAADDRMLSKKSCLHETLQRFGFCTHNDSGRDNWLT